MKSLISSVKSIFCKELPPGKYFILLCSLFAGICFLTALSTFIIDPYVYFHKAWGLKQLWAKSYAMIPGLLRNEEYDTVLFGSSIAQNFLISDLNTLYNGRSIKATSPGLPAEALSKYIELACRKKSFRHAVIAVDHFAFTKSPETSPRLQYDYLYKKSIFPVRYLLSNDSVNSSFKMVRANVKQLFSKKKVKDLDRDFMFGWYKKCSQAHFEAGIKEGIRKKSTPLAITAAAFENLEKYLFRHIKENPDITFDLFFPPYHIYFWCAMKKEGKLEGYLRFRDHIIARATAFSNVRFHDFQAETSIICHGELYRDETHYSTETNRKLIGMMKSKSHLAGEKEGSGNTRKIRDLIPRYMDGYLQLCR